MYSRCPHCETQRRVTTAQLQKSRGLLRCRGCGQRFDALARLVDDKRATHSKSAQSKPAPWPVASASTENRRFHALGSVAMLLLLVGQVMFFYGALMARQPQVQHLATVLCGESRCGLPLYRNIDVWTLSHGDLQMREQGRYQFSAALSRQDDLTQVMPDLLLTLVDYAGETVVQRVFTPQQYLASDSSPSNQSVVEIRLELVVPNTEIGGFTYQLL